MDWDFWITLLRFLWRRDSESAFGLIIWLELFLDTDDLRITANYLQACHQYRLENSPAAPDSQSGL